MCVIIYKPAGAVLDHEILARAVLQNRDGFGIAVWHDHHWRVRHTLQTRELLCWAQRVKEDDPAVIHCRAATSGSIDTARCHPFHLGRGRYLAHNGLIPAFSGHRVKSDTQKLVELLRCVPNDATVLGILRALPGRFAFLQADGGVELIGDWTEHGGLRYSNATVLGTPVVIHIRGGRHERRPWRPWRLKA